MNERKKERGKKLTHFLINVSIHDEFTSGTFLHANAAALITRSVTDIFMLSFDSCSFRSFLTLENKIFFCMYSIDFENFLLI